MRALAVVVALAAAAFAAGDARADEPSASDTKPWFFRLIATTFVGDGLRFDNPYRLATPLGASAESVSRTASYVDVGGAVTLGGADGLAHGIALRASFAMEGVPQTVLAPSYLAFRRWTSWALYARAGIPIALSPEATWGLEAGLGGAWFARAGLGLAAELVGDVFYGAGTREIAHPAYPVVSAQLGVVGAYEVMP